MKKRTLLIDDQRTIPADYVARSFSEGLSALKDLGPWDLLLLDHDLSSYTDEGQERTGYDIIKFLELNPNLAPVTVYLVTSNPPGRTAMSLGLMKMGYRKLNEREFIKE